MLAARAIDLGDWPGAHLGLTRREAELLAVLGEGTNPGDAARMLGVSPETVRTHTRNIYRKLGVSDRAAAVAVAWREGLVDLTDSRGRPTDPARRRAGGDRLTAVAGPGSDHHLLDQVRGHAPGAPARSTTPSRSPSSARDLPAAPALDRPADADGVDRQPVLPSTCRRRKFLWHVRRAAANASLAWVRTPGQPDGRGQVGADHERPGHRAEHEGQRAADHGERPAAVGQRVGDGDGGHADAGDRRQLGDQVHGGQHRLRRVAADALRDPRWRPGEGEQPAEQHEHHQQRQRVAEHPAEPASRPAPRPGRRRRSGRPGRSRLRSPNCTVHSSVSDASAGTTMKLGFRTGSVSASSDSRRDRARRRVARVGQRVRRHVAGSSGLTDRWSAVAGRSWVGWRNAPPPPAVIFWAGPTWLGVDLLVPGVVVQVAGEGQPQVEPAGRQHGPLEVGEVAVGLGLALELGPGRHRRGQDRCGRPRWQCSSATHSK